MMEMALHSLKRLVHYTKVAKKIILADPRVTAFVKHNRRVWGEWKVREPQGQVLIDFFGIPETEIARSYFVNLLARKFGASIHSYSERRGNPVLHRIYRSYNVRTHVRPRANAAQKGKARELYDRVFPTLRSKDDLIQLKVEGIELGIDIYESFLRECNEPTVNLADSRLQKMVLRGIELILFWQDYFEEQKVKAVVTSHDNYLPFNSVCKVAYQKKVPVYLPNSIYANYVTEPFMTHRYFRSFRKYFRSLPEHVQKEGREWAKGQMQRRMSGEIGVDMNYNTASAFGAIQKEKLLEPSDRLKVIICTHCFYDNPHAFSPIPFADFYEWVNFLGEISEQTNYDWYVKVHPDPLPGTIDIVRSIIRKYPKLRELPYTASHKQLAHEGMDFALTVYGTIGTEYPLLGVQVINAAFNPRIAYGFNYHAKDREDYRRMLMNLPDMKKNPLKWDEEELYEYYFMFYSFKFSDDLVFSSYRKFSSELSAADRAGPGAYDYFLKDFARDRHERTIQRFTDFIESGKPYLFRFGPTD